MLYRSIQKTIDTKISHNSQSSKINRLLLALFKPLRFGSQKLLHLVLYLLTQCQTSTFRIFPRLPVFISNLPYRSTNWYETRITGSPYFAAVVMQQGGIIVGCSIQSLPPRLRVPIRLKTINPELPAIRRTYGHPSP